MGFIMFTCKMIFEWYSDMTVKKSSLNWTQEKLTLENCLPVNWTLVPGGARPKGRGSQNKLKVKWNQTKPYFK